MKGFASMKKRTGVLWVVLAASTVLAAEPQLERAGELYSRTDYAAALATASAIKVKDGAVYELIGKVYFMQGDYKRATDALQQAVAIEPGDSDHHLWLGRIYGRRAETSSFLTAPGLATKARQSFERAVELNPRNLEALSDLFEYYLEAPGIMGGGVGKAAALAEKVQPLNGSTYHSMLARIAEKHKQFPSAEQQLRMAIAAAPRQVGRVIDLAKFLAKTGRYQESEDAFQRAESIAPNSPELLISRAKVYIKSGRNLESARLLLLRYLEGPLTPDDPPRREAQDLLKQLPAS